MKENISLLFEGDLFNRGFSVKIKSDNINLFQLPPSPELITAYDHWQEKLYAFEKFKSLDQSGNKQGSKNNNISPREHLKHIRKERKNEYQIKKQDYNNSEQSLINQMNNWLKTPSFQKICPILDQILVNSEKLWIRLLTDHLEITKLPWQSWDFLQNQKVKYKKEVTITFSPLNLPLLKPVLHKEIRILLIFGSLENDQLQKKEEALWQNLSGVKSVKVIKNQNVEEIYQEIRTNNYDIIYLSGHSTTQENVGRFYLTDAQYLEASNLISILSTKKELKLLIFNSCDSLGFAFQLYEIKLSIPNIIGMRYLIHNQTSFYFLQELIKLFIKEGKPLHEALQLIRDSLEDHKDKYAVGSYLLPVLFQLSPQPQLWKNWFRPYPSIQELSLISGYSFLLTLCIISVRLLGLFSSFELLAYDQLMRFKPDEKADERLLIVIATPENIKDQIEQPEPKNTLSNDIALPTLSDHTLKQVLEILNKSAPVAIGLDIYRDFEATSELKPYLQQDNVFGICKKSFENRPGYKPSPEINENNIGFSDAIEDQDKILRRHILTSNKKNPDCPVTPNFSLSLAKYYLTQKNITITSEKKTPCNFTFGESQSRALTSFSKLQKKHNLIMAFLHIYQGGYHNEDLKGCQIMLNYRRVNSSIQNVGEVVTLDQILNGNVDEKMIKDRIVMIGIANYIGQSNDYWKTPYSRDEIAGVFIQAQMISQILSGALDGRSLIHPLFLWQDFLLIWFCSFSSGLLTFILTRKQILLLIPFLESLLYLLSYLLLIQGLWLPLIPSSFVIILTPLSLLITEIDFNRIAKIFDQKNIIKEVNS